MRGFYIFAAVVVAGYVTYVVRAFRRGTLSFKGQPAPPRTAMQTFGDGAGIIGGCAMALLVFMATLVGLFMAIWLIKRMWEAA